MRDHERNDKVCIYKKDVGNVSVETGGTVKSAFFLISTFCIV